MGIVAVGVALANAAVLAVYEHLGPLTAGDIASRADCLALRRVDRCSLLIARSLHGPTVRMRYNMLIFLINFSFLG